jgi:putative Holliday junction resolvase
VRDGVRLGVDVGRARIGVARCDPHALLATPLETVPRDARGSADVERILSLAAEAGAVELVVGLPLGLSGHRTPSTDDAEGFASRLAGAGGPPVRLVDERLSTTQAQGQLRAAGKKTKQTRGIIDQAAAVVILQHALDSERARGEAPGRVVAPDSAVAPDRAGGEA